MERKDEGHVNQWTGQDAWVHQGTQRGEAALASEAAKWSCHAEKY